METAVIENDATEKSNIVAEEAKAAEVAASKEAEQQQQPPPDPEIDLGEEKLKLSEIKKMREDFKNDSAWKDKNRRESEALNEQRRSLAEMELLSSKLKERPEILQQLLSPPAKRDFDAEVNTHLANRPDWQVDPNAYARWEAKGLQIAAERGETLALAKLREESMQREAQNHNLTLESQARAKYLDSKKVTQAEYEQMIGFVLQNARQTDGKYPMQSMDVAYSTLFRDKELAEVRLEASKAAMKGIEKATTRGDNGINNRESGAASPQEQEDAEFVQRVSTVRRK